MHRGQILAKKWAIKGKFPIGDIYEYILHLNLFLNVMSFSELSCNMSILRFVNTIVVIYEKLFNLVCPEPNGNVKQK